MVYGQAGMARAAGITPNALKPIEKGRRHPRPATIRKAAGAVDVVPALLIEDIDQ